MAATTLTLSPEFGGTRFGPFPPGPIALGSDAGRCQITLHAGLGVRPVHAWLTPQADGQHTLQPAELGVGLYYFARGAGHPQSVSGPVNLHLGDAFALATPSGPRFIIGQLVDQPQGGGRRRGLPTAGQMKQEVHRQLSTELGTRGPVAQLTKLFWRVRTGALLQPRYVLGFALGLAGVMATGCLGLLATLAAWTQGGG